MRHAALGLVVLALVLLTLSTAHVRGSTLSVELQPNMREALMAASSLTQITFLYPANSSLSALLSGYNDTLSWSTQTSHNDDATKAFQGYLNSEYKNVTVDNMSVQFLLNAVANSTSLVIEKKVEISAWITGIFNQTKSGLSANLAWKSFVVTGRLEFDLNNQVVDINRVGSTLMLPFSTQAAIAGSLLTMFDNQKVWGESTINFSSLNAPLSQWHRTYSTNSNTTIFTRSSKALFNMTTSFTEGDEHYELMVSYDPSSTIIVPGYALASGNYVIIVRSPSETFAEPEIAGVVVALVTVIAISAVLLLRAAEPTVSRVFINQTL